MAERKQSDSGFALLLVFLLAALIAIGLYQAMPRVVFEAQRAKEQLLIDRGEQYRRAIQLYSRKFPGQYPARMEQLENTNNTRFLRRRYKDPMTGSDEWRPIHIAGGGIFPDSLTMKPPKQKKPGDNTSEIGASSTSAGSGAPTDPNVAAIIGPDGQPVQPPAGFRGRGASDRGPLGSGMAGGVGPEGQPGDVQQSDPQNYAQQPDQQNYPQQAEGVDPNAAPDPNGVVPGQAQPGGDPAAVMIPGQPQPGAGPTGVVLPGGQMVGVSGGMVSGVVQANPNDPNQPAGDPNPPNQPGNRNYPPMPPPYPGRNMQGLPGQYAQPGMAVRPGAFPPPQPGFGGNNPVAGQLFGGQNNQQPAGSAFGQTGASTFGQTGGSPSLGQGAIGAINSQLRGPQQGVVGRSGGNMTLGSGIAGVASKAEIEGIKSYKKHTKYNEWEFIYDPRTDPSTAQGQANLMQQQMQQQQQGGIQGLGTQKSSGTKPEGTAR
jgi:type II secretory pathway pseudopilin PulG